jgi:formylglycine-generating enzyme required for sulfatase activity
VGLKRPNQFGLFDILGNVWEWTQDCWHGNYVGAPTDGSAWITGCSANERVLRGGTWYDKPADLRSAIRFRGNPGSLLNVIGFRLARTH